MSGSSWSRSWSSIGRLLGVDHQQRTWRATVHAQAATDAERLVQQQRRLGRRAPPGAAVRHDRDAVVRADVHTQAAEDAQLRLEHHVVEAAQATVAL